MLKYINPSLFCYYIFETSVIQLSNINKNENTLAVNYFRSARYKEGSPILIYVKVIIVASTASWKFEVSACNPGVRAPNAADVSIDYEIIHALSTLKQEILNNVNMTICYRFF